MSAEIIPFGGSKSAVPKIAARKRVTIAARESEPEPEPEVKREPISFSFKGGEYRLIFRWGEWRLFSLNHRMQNGRHVTCKRHVSHPDPELVRAAEGHASGTAPVLKSEEAAPEPKAGTPSTPEPDAKTVEVITRVDALR